MVSKPGRTMLVKWRSLLAALIITIIAAIAAIPSPLDRVIEMGIGHWAWRPVSGDIVVVGIDDKTMQNITSEQETLPLHASIIEKINEAGAKRVFIDYSYENRLTDPNFIELTAAVKKLGNRAILAVPSATYSGNEAVIDAWPSQEFGDQAQLACICWEYLIWQVWKIPISVAVGPKTLPSFAALLANVDHSQPSQVPIDYSYKTDSIPTYSAAHLIGGELNPSVLTGKDVILAPTSKSSSDRHYFPGHDLVPGVYIHVVAGETLKRGVPIRLAWPYALAASFLFLALILCAGRTSRFLIFALAYGIGLAAVKILASNFLINIMIGPALTYLAFASFMVNRARHRLLAQNQNPVSGLPNFNAMRSSANFDRCSVISAQVVNFEQLLTYLSHEDSVHLIGQVARRLELATTGSQLYHDADGSFAWTIDVHHRPDLISSLSGLAALFNAPITIDSRRVDVKIAFGVNDEPGESNTQRLAAARGAVERAVRNRSLIEYYAGGRSEDAAWKLSFHSQMEEAMASGDIWVAYQPQYQISTGRLCGLEALARWTHPERGIIPPDQFIRQAEQSNDIYRLTLFVMEQALQSFIQLRLLRQDISISVNLSAALLDRPGLSKVIQDMLLEKSFPAEHFTIEITETAQFEHGAQALETLAQLRSFGIRLSIDDYGTGQSNLEYLTQIEADEIKIDKRFVGTMRDSQRNFEIVKSTIDLAHSLGAVAVAEGIEDHATLALLSNLGCDVAQGYHLGKPQLFYEILASLRQTPDVHSA